MSHDFPQLNKPIQFLKGVGPKRSEVFGRMGIVTARDLLYHVPRRYDDASTIQPVNSLDVGADATAVGRVRSKGIVPTRSGLRIFQAVLQDESGMITCAWPGQPWLDRKIKKGDLLLVTGPVKFFHGRQLQPCRDVGQLLVQRLDPLQCFSWSDIVGHRRGARSAAGRHR